MKRNYLLCLLPLLALTGCSSAQKISSNNVMIDRNLPVLPTLGEGSHTTYLMMSRYGYLEIGGTKTYGEDVPEKFYENCIVWKSAANGALPTKDQVKSKVDGATFVGWAQYNDNIYLDYLTNVPSATEKAVYAIFEGPTDSGGNTPVTNYNATFSVDVSTFEAWGGCSGYSVYAWGANGEEPLGKWANCVGNLAGSGSVKTVTASNLNYKITGIIFFFDQDGATKQTTNITANISTTGTYIIAPTGNITWSEGKMSNFKVTKAS